MASHDAEILGIREIHDSGLAEQANVAMLQTANRAASIAVLTWLCSVGVHQLGERLPALVHIGFCCAAAVYGTDRRRSRADDCEADFRVVTGSALIVGLPLNCLHKQLVGIIS